VLVLTTSDEDVRVLSARDGVDSDERDSETGRTDPLVGYARKEELRHAEIPPDGLLSSDPKARFYERWSGLRSGLTDTAGRVGSSRVG